MSELGGILAAIVVASIYIGSLLFLRAYRKEFTVFQYQRGLLFNNGKLIQILEGGKHSFWGKGYTIQIVDTRITTTPVGNQEILTSDGLSIKVTATARYQIVDPKKAILGSQMFLTDAYLSVQLALRDAVTALTADEVILQRREIAATVTEECLPKFESLGLNLEGVELRDITFPGELRKAMAQVALAQKEGLASLERARGEAAALRTLANAARLLEGNPALMQLRMLQSLNEAKSATIVLNATDQSFIPVSQTPAP